MNRIVITLMIVLLAIPAIAEVPDVQLIDALFVHQSTSRGVMDARVWQEVLRDYMIDCHLVPKTEIEQAALYDADLIIIGPHSREHPKDKQVPWYNYWGDPQLMDFIARSELPVVGISMSGQALFGQMDLPVGGGYFMHGKAQTFELAENARKYLQWPFVIDPNKPIEISTREQGTDGYHQPPSYVESLLKKPDSVYYPVVRYKNYVVWGAGSDAGYFTDAGRRLFSNIVHVLVRR